MAQTGLKELLQAGVHFGHQTRRWNPNMRRFIHGERDGIHIIDLLQTEELLEQARVFAGELTSGGGTVLFVGTKKQARDSLKEWADRCQMPYVNLRWLGGLLTNFQTISQRIARLHELKDWQDTGRLELLPTKERMSLQAELTKLEFNLGGVRDMERLPDAILVLDLKTEDIGVREAARLRIPIIGLVDTNCDPTPVNYVIPGNDDAIRSCELIISTIGGAIEEGSGAWRAEEERKRAIEAERRRVEEEERRKREEEDKARKEAEEVAQAEAAAVQAAQAAQQAQQAAQQPQQAAQPRQPAQRQSTKPVARSEQTKQAPAPAKAEAPAKPEAQAKPEAPAEPEAPAKPRIPDHPQAIAPDADPEPSQPAAAEPTAAEPAEEAEPAPAVTEKKESE